MTVIGASASPEASSAATPVRLDDRGDEIIVTASAYTLRIDRRRPFAEVVDPDGVRWARLALLVSVNVTHGTDATYPSDVQAAGVRPLVISVDTRLDEVAIVLTTGSLRWGRHELSLRCGPDAISLRAVVEGTGDIESVTYLGGTQAGFAGWPAGDRRSAFDARSLVSGSPASPSRIAIPASEAAAVGADGAGHPGGGRWFFTPGPLAFALGRGAPDPHDGTRLPAGPWLTLGLGPRPGEATFVAATFEPVDGAASIRLAYDGQTRVAGRFEAPELRIGFAPDPYTGFADHGRALEVAGLVPPPSSRPARSWWLEPIWCGWGAQCHEARALGVRPDTLATAERYDRWLGSLERRGIVPGTIVIDDGWQLRYGTNEPDPKRWPDLRAWVAARHARGQRVLLWWKAWDPDGLPLDACVTTPAGTPVTADPTSAAYRRVVTDAVRRLLGPDGVDADGFKLDFTAHTPSGPGLRRAGSAWGIELLRSLVSLLSEAARAVKPDALLVAHTANPMFRDSVGILRLNDALRLEDAAQPDDVVASMRHRARIAAAACPELAIDTDDWALPSLDAWRRYQVAKPALGIPALYAVDAVDPTGEPLTPDDDALIRETWARWRASSARRGIG